MRLSDIKDYVDAKQNLTKIDFTAEVGEFNDDLYVTKTKETYVYESEDDADAKINDVRQDPLFVGAEKKYKAGKMNKAGEVVKAETWTVVVKLSH